MDGTLVDSAGGLADALDHTLIIQQLPAAGKELVSTWVGNGVNIMIELALTWANVKITPEIKNNTRQLFDKIYATTVITGSQLFPGVKETLAEIAKQPLPMAIVTNKPTPFIDPLLKKLTIDCYFSLIFGGDDVKEKKPHPALLYLTMEKFCLHKD